jgi:hypothetical protein
LGTGIKHTHIHTQGREEGKEGKEGKRKGR